MIAWSAHTHLTKRRAEATQVFYNYLYSNAEDGLIAKLLSFSLKAEQVQECTEPVWNDSTEALAHCPGFSTATRLHDLHLYHPWQSGHPLNIACRPLLSWKHK